MQGFEPGSLAHVVAQNSLGDVLLHVGYVGV